MSSLSENYSPTVTHIKNDKTMGRGILTNPTQSSAMDADLAFV